MGCMRRRYPACICISPSISGPLGQKMMRLHRWDKALAFARKYYALDGQKGQIFTVPLLDGFPLHPNGGKLEDMPKDLPKIWPFWCVPQLNNVKKEIQKDPRRDAWVKQSQR